jgi:hypothetical protein
MRDITAAVAAATLFWTSVAMPAVRGEDVQYVGGTISNLEGGTEGSLDTSDPKVIKFNSKKGSFEIPYQGITSVEYGQKAGRRVGVAIAISPWIPLSKKRKHFLTLGYKDASEKQQGVVLELPKGTPRAVIAIIEARSGVKCEYESEEAKKHVHG